MADFPGKTVQKALEDTLNALEEELREYWTGRLEKEDVPEVITASTPRDQWYEELRKMGKEGFTLAEALVGPDFLHTYELQTAIESDDIYRGIPMTALQIQAARRFAYELPELATRASKVAYHALHTKLPPRVQRFLNLLGRCYVSGLHAEVLVLCRACLEAALRERLEELEGKSPRGFKQVIDHAVRESARAEEGEAGSTEGWPVIHRDFKHHAHWIRVLGNEAIHKDPGAEDEVFEVIKATVHLIRDAFDPVGEYPLVLLRNPRIPTENDHRRMAADHFQRLAERIKQSVSRVLDRDVSYRPQVPQVVSVRKGSAYGDPSADVMFVSLRPTPNRPHRVKVEGNPKFCGDVSWNQEEGDQFFRETLLQHGFKMGAWGDPTGWNCYVTSLIKEVDVARPAGEESQVWPEDDPELWKGVFSWELGGVDPVIVVPMGDDARSALREWDQEEDPFRVLIPEMVPIPHFDDVASQSREGLGPDPVLMYREAVGKVARRLRELQTKSTR